MSRYHKNKRDFDYITEKCSETSNAAAFTADAAPHTDIIYLGRKLNVY